MGGSVLYVDDADYAIAPDNGRGEERFKRILGKVLEILESGITVGLARDRQQPALPSYPACQPFIKLQADLANCFRMFIIRSTEDQAIVVHKIQEAGIAAHELHYQRHGILKRGVCIHVPNHRPADPLEQSQLLLGAFEVLLEFPNSAGHELYYGSVHLSCRPRRTLLRHHWVDL